MASSIAEQDLKTLRQLIDRAAIEDVMRRYARGVDRSDFELVRSTYHPGAYDDHGDYQGSVEGFIPWLAKRLEGSDNGMHLLGNCLIEFAGPDSALVETYFVSQRLLRSSIRLAAFVDQNDFICRQRWGRYVDRFERRVGEWRIASRTVVFDSGFHVLALNVESRAAGVWGQRNTSDHYYDAHAEMFGAHRTDDM